MKESGPVQVVIELDRAGGTISGELAVEGAPARGFFGWLELIHRLDGAMGGEQNSNAGGEE